MFWEDFVLWAEKLIVQFSYLAIFGISAIGTSTLFIPFPIDTIIIFAASGLGLHPLIVGISAGLGAAVGELTGYFIGAGGRFVIEEKKTKRKLIGNFVSFMTGLFKKYGEWVIPIAAFLPFPFDIVGILCGMSKYDMKKFFIATLIGKIARSILIAYVGYFVIPLFAGWLGLM
ncbi:MAG TPA: VTT domain-containing protein [archaeon]|nr:VTT domain-containing protein [archaeon]